MSPKRASAYLGCLILGYIGVYLCRKNLSVAIPLIQEHFGVSKAELGKVASVSTIAYAGGKIFFGPIIDRVGGRICFLLALLGVAIFGGIGAFSVSIPMLTLAYSANRYCGSAGWGSMMKQVPNWFPPSRMAFVMAILSLSFVFGGTCSLFFAGWVAKVSHNNWQAVMGIPSIVLVVIFLICACVLPTSKTEISKGITTVPKWAETLEIFRIPQFWVVCGLSFILTITRETFNVWTVDFLKTGGSETLSTNLAAMLSTPFDAAGAVGILILGWFLDKLSNRARKQVLFVNLTLLAVFIYALPALLLKGLAPAVAAIAAIGFLSYGPYSLLAGIFSVEIRGPKSVATVAGLVDAAGYLAGIISGYYFGAIVDRGGYPLGFHVLAIITFSAAILCQFLRKNERALTQSV